MSKKKNKKKALLALIDPKKDNATTVAEVKPPIMVQLAHTLFKEILRDKFHVINSVLTKDIDIIAYTDDDTDPDNVCCYTLSPSSNKNVSIYVDDEKIEIELDKKKVEADDEELGFLVANIINYLNTNCTSLIA